MPTTEALTALPTPAAPQIGSLYQILDELVELAALADDPELADDERVAIAEQIAKYVSAEIAGRKVDGIAATLRECKARAEIAAEESKRLAKRSESWLARMERIKASTLRAMQAHGVPKIETPTNRLRIQGNGGLQELLLFAPSEVPVELRRVTVKLGGEDHVKLFDLIARSAGLRRDEKVRLLKLLEAAFSEPDGERIREALKGRVVCPDCKGTMDVNKGCEKCGNTGTVPASVPGARLLERGVHLRVE